METLPPVLLGVSLLIPFMAALAVRKPLEIRFVDSQPRVAQPKKQFYFDLALCLAAGSAVVVYNTIAYGFPVASGISLLLGCTVIGFFLGLDTALAREREVIHEALAGNSTHPPPKQLYSMTRKFSLVAFTTTIFLSLVLGLVIARDVVWLAKIEQSGMSVAKAQLSMMG
jgi:sigma-B regulation protein RsbU (phosphoserine phosphatase)